MPISDPSREPQHRTCPLDASPLVGLDVSRPKGWGFYNPRLLLTEDFCPRCDTAFLTLDDRVDVRGSVQILRWKRIGGQLIPCQPDEEGLLKLSRKMWEVRKTLLFYHVALFVFWRTRLPPRTHCPNDGGGIQVLGAIPYGAGSWIGLSWCRFCRVGFGRLSDRVYGWCDCLTFWWDAYARSFRASPTEIVKWPHGRVTLDLERIKNELNTLILSDREGVPIGVRPEAGQMESEDVPNPGALPKSLWDGWMTGFKPGVLSGKRHWRD